MSVDEKNYEADDPRRQLPDVTLDVEGVQITCFDSRLTLRESDNYTIDRNGGLRDANKYKDSSCYEDIKLFEEDLVLTDSPYEFDCQIEPMRIENVRKVGREMLYHNDYTISFAFLILNDVRQAFQICKEIECNQFIKPEEQDKYKTSGEKLLLAIVNHARKKKLDRFDVKVICALHLLERYLAIEALVPDISRGSEIRESVMNKFRNREHAYLPIERVNLYSICESLGHRDKTDVMEKLRAEFGPRIKSSMNSQRNNASILSSVNLETNLLELFWRGLLVPNQAELTLEKIIPQSIVATWKRSNDARIQGDEIAPKKPLTCKRGKVLIINQRQFANRSSPSSPSWKTPGDVESAQVHGKTETDAESFEIREGTNIDEEALRHTWEYFCGPANVKTVHDLTAAGIRGACNNFRTDLETSNPDDVDYMVLCILSHGRNNPNTNQDEIMGTQWEGVPTNELIDMFALGTSCPAMVGKPKIFIIQACRGRDPNDVVESKTAYKVQKYQADSDLQEDAPSAAPKKSWYFILQSTIQGFSAWRHRTEGSFFIQCLCQELRRNGPRKDILAIAQDAIFRVQNETRLNVPIFEYTLGSFMYLKEFQPLK